MYKNCCTSEWWVGKFGEGGILVLYKLENENNILVHLSHLCDLFSRHKANTLALLISKVKISEGVGVGSVVAYGNWYSERKYVIYI